MSETIEVPASAAFDPVAYKRHMALQAAALEVHGALIELHADPSDSLGIEPSGLTYAGRAQLTDAHVRKIVPWYVESKSNKDGWCLPEDNTISIVSYFEKQGGLPYQRTKGILPSLEKKGLIETQTKVTEDATIPVNVRTTPKARNRIREYLAKEDPIFITARDSILQYAKQNAYFVWREVKTVLDTTRVAGTPMLKDMEAMELRQIHQYTAELRENHVELLRVLDPKLVEFISIDAR